MAKKTWIKIKRGLVDDPKHRMQIGEAIWLFFHIIDRAEFETGIIHEWKDSDEAEQMSMPVKTLRNHRRRLETAGYIESIQGKHKQQLRIMKWVNPRSYSGEVLNTEDVINSGHNREPLEFDGDHNGSLYGDHYGALEREPSITSLSHNTKNHLPKRNNMSADVEIVMERYRDILQHPRAKLEKKRRELIAGWLKTYSIDDLTLAFRGNKKSEFHQGMNDRNQIYDSLELILRDAKRIEQFIAIAENGNGAGRTVKERKTINAVNGVIEDLRNEARRTGESF